MLNEIMIYKSNKTRKYEKNIFLKFNDFYKIISTKYNCLNKIFSL